MKRNDMAKSFFTKTKIALIGYPDYDGRHPTPKSKSFKKYLTDESLITEKER
jgi:hypothetical protein